LRTGHSYNDSAFCAKLTSEKRNGEFTLQTHLAFADYEKVFDIVERQIFILEAIHQMIYYR